MPVTSPAFDFKQKLSTIQPKAAPAAQAPDEEKRVDQVAQRHDFVSRETLTRVERVRGTEPIDVMSVKGPLSVLSRFKQYCNETNQPYWRVLDEMMKQMGR
jgi:hypothetical protein